MFDLGVTAPAVYGTDGEEVVEGIERAAASGAGGVEFFDWESVDAETVRSAAEDHGVEVFGVLAAGAASNVGDPDSPAAANPGDHDEVVADLERSIEGAAALGAETVILTVGNRIESIDEATQRSAVVDVLRAVAPTAEAEDVTVVLEPLNARVDHPGYFLRTISEGVGIVDAVDSPNVKLLFDVYHQQITEGDVIRLFREHVEHIGHVHVADNPGRHEPGTGELDYGAILEAIAETGYDGWVSGEFSPAGDADEAVERLVSLADDART